MSVFKLHVHNEAEVFDLHIWSEEHPDAAFVEREQVRGFLDRLLETAGHAYPLIVPVPADVAPMLEALIEDWVEVLTAHNEQFFTSLMEE